MLSAEYRVVDKSKIRIDDRELSARLGKICSHKDPDLSRIVDSVITAAEPKYAVRSCAVSINGSDVELGFGRVNSDALAKCLSGFDRAYVIALTLGISVDRLISKISRLSTAEAFVYDAVASALTEAVCEFVQSELCGSLPSSVRYAVGYGDFSLEHQGAVLDYLGAKTYLGISLTKANLMVPFKTVTAIIGVK